MSERVVPVTEPGSHCPHCGAPLEVGGNHWFDELEEVWGCCSRACLRAEVQAYVMAESLHWGRDR